jgi:glycosyltransferase involved in cell wall biosynthesis
MRIALIGQKGIPFSQDAGGVERHVEELSVRLAKMGHEVFVYIRPRFLVADKKEYQGVKLISLPSIPTKNLDTITHTFLATLHVLFKKVDVIHYHGVGPSTMAWIPKLFKRKTKVIVTFHSIDKFHKKWGWFARHYLGWGEWTACHYPHVTIAVSHSIQEYCRGRYGREAVYIPNGVSIRHVNSDNLIKKFGLESDNYILTVARLVKHKGIHHLIQAYKILEKKYGTDPANWPGGKIRKLVIVGAPSYTEDYLVYLKNLAEGNPNIIFTGMQLGNDLAQLFANAYLYVHPSEAEGLSITILEAMSYGRCVLVSDIPENLEVVDHGGYSFESKNVSDLYEKLVYLLDFSETVKRRGEHGLEFIHENFNWDEIAGQVEALYKGVI